MNGQRRCRHTTDYPITLYRVEKQPREIKTLFSPGEEWGRPTLKLSGGKRKGSDPSQVEWRWCTMKGPSSIQLRLSVRHGERERERERERANIRSDSTKLGAELVRKLRNFCKRRCSAGDFELHPRSEASLRIQKLIRNN